MPKNKQVSNLSLAGFNDIFSSTVESNNSNNPAHAPNTECIVEIPIDELFSPEFHPFHVNDDESMDRLAQNIKQYGVREPGLARPRKDENGNPNGYELLAGNRRKRACEIAELATMPVIIREIDDANATIAMVDSNLEQRETLLFSEKAWAYRIKMEALNHNGVKGDKHSYEILMEQTGESKNQIFRLIRLTELVVGLLDMVDGKKIAFNPAVELSYLSQVEQNAVISAMENHGIKPSHSQAVQLKKLKMDGNLKLEMIDKILSKAKKPLQGENDKEISHFRKYFPEGYTTRQINEVISELLQEWQSKRHMLEVESA